MSQALQALEMGNALRLRGVQFRRKVAAQSSVQGRLTLARALERRRLDPEVGAMRLIRFLTAARVLGESKALEICTVAGVYRRDPRLRELTLRERSALAAELRRRAAVTGRQSP